MDLKKLNQIMAVIVSVAMVFTQIIPAGLAEELTLEELTQKPVPMLSFTQSEESVSSSGTVESTYEDFMDDRSLQPLRSQDETPSQNFSEDPAKPKMPSVSGDEANEVEAVLGQKPADSKLTAAGATSNHQWTVTEYYGEDGVLIGSKRVDSYVSPMGETWKPSETSWYDAAGNWVRSTLMDRYYRKLDELDSFMSGIAVGGISLDQIKNLRAIQDALKGVLEQILANGQVIPKVLITLFNDTVKKIDSALASRPLLVTAGETTIEVAVSELMRVLHEEYTRLGLVDTQDLARLPGVDPEDLVGHENFKAYLDSRQIGVTTLISVFQGLSPYGNITFTDQLVRKYFLEYGDSLLIGDNDNDGKPEINFIVLRRVINGTEPLYREAMSLIDELAQKHNVVIPSGGIGTFEELKTLVEGIEALFKELRDRLGVFASAMTVEPAFKRGLLSEINRVVDAQYQSLTGQVLTALDRVPNPIDSIVARHPIVFPQEGAVSFDALIGLAAEIAVLFNDLDQTVSGFYHGYDVKTALVNKVHSKVSSLAAGHRQIQQNQLRDVILYGRTEINEIVESHAIVIPAEATISFARLSQIYGQIDSLQEDLTEKLRTFAGRAKVLVDRSDLAEVLKSAVISKVNGWSAGSGSTYQWHEGLYVALTNRMNSALWGKNIEFDIEGAGKVLMSPTDLNVLTGSLPRDISALLKFPGIQARFDAEILKTLEKNHEDNDRRQIDLTEPVLYPNEEYLSARAVRTQFISLFLEAYKDRVIRDGRVHHDEFRKALLMNEEIENLFLASKAVIEAGVARVHELVRDVSRGITTVTYDLLLEILKTTNETVSAILGPTVNNLIDEAKNLLRDMAQNLFNSLIAAVNNITSRALIRVTIGGREYTVNAREVMDLIQTILPRIAVSPNNNAYNTYSFEQYARLNGITLEMLKELKGSSELDRYRRIDFTQPLEGNQGGWIQDSEYFFRMTALLLRNLGSGIIGEDGQVSLDRVGEQVLREVYAPVAKGESIQTVFMSLLERVVAEAVQALKRLDFSKWEDRIRAEAIYSEALKSLQDSARPLILGLNASEIMLLESRANRPRYYWETNPAPRFGEVWEALQSLRNSIRPQTVTLPDGKILKLDLASVQSIPGFPYGTYYDQELFPGISAGDFENTGIMTASSVKLLKDGYTEVPRTSFDRDAFTVNLLIRHYQTLNQLPELYRDRLFTGNDDGTVSLNREVFRRLIKGVDLLHKQILDQTTAWTRDELEKVKELQKVPMTVDSIRGLLNEIMTFRQKIMNYLNGLTQRHEKEDVIEMEEAVTAVYKQVIDELIGYLRHHPLTTKVAGIEITIPAAELTRRMMAAVEEKFPGEDIGAHHFAAFYGITIDDLRQFNKLEEFLGMQIIALPRNSQYVEIISKLSEIGMMEMMEAAIQRYAGEVIQEGMVDMDRLMQVLTDSALAVEKAKARADEIAAGVRDLLASWGERLTVENLTAIAAAFDEMKLNLVNDMNDTVSGFTQAMFDEVQAYVSSLYQDLVSQRDDLILTRPIRIKAKDGTEFTLRLSDLEEPVVERIMSLLAQYSQREWDPGPVLFEPQPDDYRTIRLNYMVETITEVALLPEVRGAKEPIQIIRPVWYPVQVKYDPNDRPTRFGFLTLLVRVAERFGAFTVDENGDFSLENFLENLGLTDQQRAEQRIRAIKDEVLSELRARVPADPSQGINLVDIVNIHQFLDGAKAKFLDALNQYSGTNRYQVIELANAAWREVMSKYEELLFDRPVLVEIDGRLIVIPAKVMADIFEEEYSAGNRGLAAFYLAGGETQSVYKSYKSLGKVSYYDRYSYSDGGSQSGTGAEAEDPENPYPYPFTFGELARIPGINAEDLYGLDVVAKNSVVLTLIEAKELLKGRLNMRVFAPGSSVQTVGLAAMRADMAVTTAALDYLLYESKLILTERITDFITEIRPDGTAWRPIYNYDWKPPYSHNLSRRDILFRLIPAMVKDYYDRIKSEDGSTIDAEKFRDLLKNPEVVKEREAKLVLASLQTQADAFKNTLRGGQGALAPMGLTGVVQYDGLNGGYYLMAFEPSLHRLLVKYGNGVTGLLDQNISGDEGFGALLQATGLSADAILKKPVSELLPMIPYIRYELGPDYVIPRISDVLQADALFKALGEGANAEELSAIVKLPSFSWAQYSGKMINIEKANVSFRMNENGTVEGVILGAAGVTGIQYASAAMNLLTGSSLARQTKILREAYIDHYVRRDFGGLSWDSVQAIAENLKISVKDIVSIRSEDRMFMTCKGPGCATWSKYLSVVANVNGKEKHFAGTLTGGWWGMDERSILIEPVLRDEKQGDLTGVLGGAVAEPETMKTMLRLNALRPPSVFLLETDSHIDGRALEAIAHAAGFAMEQVVSVSFKLHGGRDDCLGTGCLLWSGDLEVTVKQGDHPERFFKGEIAKIFHAEPDRFYRVKLTEQVDIYQEYLKVFQLFLSASGEAALLREEVMAQQAEESRLISESYYLSRKLNGAAQYPSQTRVRLPLLRTGDWTALLMAEFRSQAPDYAKMRDWCLAWIASLEESIRESRAVKDALTRRIENLTASNQDLQEKIEARSRAWVVKAEEVLHAYSDVIVSSKLLNSFETFSSAMVSSSMTLTRALSPVSGATAWVQRRFYEVELKDGRKVTLEFRNGEINVASKSILDQCRISLVPAEPEPLPEKKAELTLTAAVSPLFIGSYSVWQVLAARKWFFSSFSADGKIASY